MRSSGGFTLVELVATMAIMAILAVFAGARANLFSGVDDAGAAQLIIGHIGAAQRLAISQRRPVYVVIAPGSIRICADAACAQPYRSMDGKLLAISAGSLQFGSTNASFFFDSQGRSSAVKTVVSITYGSQIVRIEPETGLVW